MFLLGIAAIFTAKKKVYKQCRSEGMTFYKKENTFNYVSLLEYFFKFDRLPITIQHRLWRATTF